jgi:glycosyltransferase involved in cell wall biosynthesis
MTNDIKTFYSIVIATVGRPCLKKTLNDIARSSQLPNEVYIILPRGSDFLVSDHFHDDKLKVVTLFGDKGQVKQRAVGLGRVQNDVVIQMDDDIRFDNFVLEQLINEVVADTNLAVAPLIFDEKNCCRTGVDITQNRFFQTLAGAIAEKQSQGVGYVSKIGLAVRPCINSSGGLIHSEWLPGGCMAFHRKFISKERDIWNPEGKFFGEDIINCVKLKNQGVSFAFVSGAKVFTRFDNIIGFSSARTHFWSLIYIQRLIFGQPQYFTTAFFCVIRFVYQVIQSLRRWREVTFV